MRRLLASLVMVASLAAGFVVGAPSPTSAGQLCFWAEYFTPTFTASNPSRLELDPHRTKVCVPTVVT